MDVIEVDYGHKYIMDWRKTKIDRIYVLQINKRLSLSELSMLCEAKVMLMIFTSHIKFYVFPTRGMMLPFSNPFPPLVISMISYIILCLVNGHHIG